MASLSGVPSSLGENTVVTCKEYEKIEVDPGQLVDDEGRLTSNAEGLNKWYRVEYSKGNNLSVYARGSVGIFPLTESIIVQVVPRFRVDNITAMVARCGEEPIPESVLRPYDGAEDTGPWARKLLTESFLDAMEKIGERGLWRVYKPRVASGSTLTGSIDIGRTIRQSASRGIGYRANYRWFQPTVDHPANRCLKYAAGLLHKECAEFARPSATSDERKLHSKIGNIMLLLDQVEDDTYLDFLSDDSVRGLTELPLPRHYYRRALDIALAIINGENPSLDTDVRYSDGDFALTSMMTDMSHVFENYVRISLEDRLDATSNVRVLDGNTKSGQRPLYVIAGEDELSGFPVHRVLPEPSGNQHDSEPDLVFEAFDGEVPVVGDVKYTKVKKDSYSERSVLEQIVLYGVRYGSAVIMAVHPCLGDARQGLHVAGKMGEMIVTQYRVNLGNPDLTGEMDKMAADISELINAVRGFSE